MGNSLIRLAWALPLVLALGVGVLLMLRRHGIGMPRKTTSDIPIVLSTTPISANTTAIVIRHGAREWLVFESSQALCVESCSTHGATPSPNRLAWPLDGNR